MRSKVVEVVEVEELVMQRVLGWVLSPSLA